MPLNKTDKLLLLLVGLVCLLRALSGAWVSEDAYISFRVIDNFVHGFGLRWNVDERVQVYTHPLWLLLHIPFYAALGHLYLVDIALSVACLAVTLVLLARAVPTTLETACFIIVPVMLSRSLMDYSVSGFENPLSMLCLAWFLLEFMREGAGSVQRLVLAASLSACTRLDNTVLMAPPLLYALWAGRPPLRFAKLLALSSPLWGWLGFSLVYYGFFLPNTRYAKIVPDIPWPFYLQQGALYLKSLPRYDPAGTIFIACALVTGLRHLRERLSDPAERKLILLALGILAHLAYITYVGGDYMAGRFFTEDILTAIIMMATYAQRRPRVAYGAVLASLALCFAALVPGLRHNIFRPQLVYDGGVVDRRWEEFKSKALLSRRNRVWLAEMTVDPRERTMSPHRQMRVDARAGTQFFFSGPGFIDIDSYALCDAFIARLPPRANGPFWAGHLMRNLPAGYEHARKTGDLSKMDPALALYYGTLRLVIAGDLFTVERWRAILGFQRGEYDYLIQEYKAKHR